MSSAFNEEKISTIGNPQIREALLRRLAEFGGDAKKAFTGKNSLEKIQSISMIAIRSKCHRRLKR